MTEDKNANNVGWTEGSKKIEAMKYTLFYLRIHNIWPPENEQFNPSRMFKTKFVLMVVFCSFIIPPVVLSTVNGFKNEAWLYVSASLADLASYSGCLYIYTATFFVQKDLAQLYSEITSFHEFGKSEKYYLARKLLNLLSHLNYLYTGLGFVARIFFNTLEIKPCKANNLALNYTISCDLFVPFFFSKVIQSLSTEICIYVWQFLNCFLIIKGAAAFSFTLYESATYLGLRVDQLNEMLLRMFDSDSEDVQRAAFVTCVKYHQLILSLARRMNGCYRNIMFVHFIMTGGIFGVLGNLIIKKRSIADIMHFFGWVIALFVVCIGGQDLNNKFETINVVAYDSKWYTVNANLQRDFQLLLLMGRKNVVLKAGPFGVLSNSLFLDIVKTSYSYMAFVQRNI